MSWSVSAIGNREAVAVEIERQFATMGAPCPEPEESVKQSMRAAIATALAQGTGAVKVEANGTQYTPTRGSETLPVSLSTSLKIEPLFGFLE